MKKIQFLHEVNLINMGDLMSCPLNYFNFKNTKCIVINIKNQAHLIDPKIPLIVGGGGMMIDDYYPVSLYEIIRKHKSKVILWGAGVNNNYIEKNDFIHEEIKNISLAGIRDYELAVENNLIYVPCCSCLHNSFDKIYEIKYNAVCYEGSKLNLPFPTMSCLSGTTMSKTIEFLSSGRSIITSSYHGMYWGNLIGRNTIVVPNLNSSKFYYMPEFLLNNIFLYNSRIRNIEFSKMVEIELETKITLI